MTDIIFEPLKCFIAKCLSAIQNQEKDQYDRLQSDCESLISAVCEVNGNHGTGRFFEITLILEEFLQIIRRLAGKGHRGAGRPQIKVPVEAIEDLLWMKFSVPKIASVFHVSVSTIRNRMKEYHLTVSATYTDISDHELHEQIASVLKSQPNTGCKLMKGMLWHSRRIRVTEARLRDAMRKVDPWGVQERLLRNRAVVRRSYFVKYSHSLWHMDTNMKLIRYKMVIRGCLDGKSRFCIYLDVGNNNRAISTLESFMEGVRMNCVPSRTRSDKGGENVLVARLMIETRGVERGSHLTGRSVHNQRIERFWLDVNRASSYFYETFFEMELSGILNIDNDLHMYILHHVYLPRIQASMTNFRLGWNSHPVSTERNCTPEQMLYINTAPSPEQLVLNDEEILDMYCYCNQIDDLLDFEDEDNPIRNPQVFYPDLGDRQQVSLLQINVLRDSFNNGIDIYIDCLNAVTNC